MNNYAFVYYNNATSICRMSPIYILGEAEAKNESSALKKFGYTSVDTYFYKLIRDNFFDENDYKKTFAYQVLEIKSLSGEKGEDLDYEQEIAIIKLAFLEKYIGTKDKFIKDIRKNKDSSLKFDIINTDTQLYKIMKENGVLIHYVD